MKQIVGGSLTDDPSALKTNFVAEHSAAWYAQLYKQDQLHGGHIIQLGEGNEHAAREALRAYPGGLQLGGGVNVANARHFLDAGASHVIVTSFVFHEGRLDDDRLRDMKKAVGRERLVLDLSCRRRDGAYFVVTDRWQKFTDLKVCAETLSKLGESCAEFLVHGVDVEGLCQGVDLELVSLLADNSPIAVTYAGGAQSLEDLREVSRRSAGRVDLTIGSALDIFGGTGVRYADAVAFNKQEADSRRDGRRLDRGLP